MGGKKQSAPSLLVFGDINVDIIGRTKAWPRPGDDCAVQKLELHCGGVGANTALALSPWGVKPHLMGCVGIDDFGRFLLRALRSGGVDTRGVQITADALSGMFYINVTPDGQRTFFGSRGANRLTRPSPLVASSLLRMQAAHLMGYNFLDVGPERVARQIIRRLHADGKWVSLDVGMEASQRIGKKILRLLREIDLLFVSSDEAARITGKRDAEKAFREFEHAGAREVVLKLGKRGCLISEGGVMRRVPSFSVPAVDSTGAGDAFTAAFLQTRLRGWSRAEAALVANAAGAAAASVVGAGAMLANLAGVIRLLRGQRLPGRWDAVRLQVLARLQTMRSATGRLK
jgi:sugar/nucleoside kinase (ribokinase family)